MRRRLGTALLLALLAAAAGCDRRIEPFVPGEEPSEPDLSKIFPAGSERQSEAPLVPPPPPGRQGPAPAPAVGGGEAPLRGTIRLAEALMGRVPPGATLFLIARPGEAGPPLAVKRIPNPTFPLPFVLGPEDRMIEAMPFAGELRVTARVDQDGNATSRTPGDLQGAAVGTYAPGAADIDLVLDEIL